MVNVNVMGNVMGMGMMMMLVGSFKRASKYSRIDLNGDGDSDEFGA
jgi:hypothetical protein